MRRYAQDTTVKVEKTRQEIARLLRNFGCDQIRWDDNMRTGLSLLEFIWLHEGLQYHARFPLQLPTEADLREQARHAKTGKLLDAKLNRLREASGREENRLLLLLLKAILNAVESGILEPAMIFLPFLVDKNDKTFGEVAVPKLPMLLKTGGQALLSDMRSVG